MADDTKPESSEPEGEEPALRVAALRMFQVTYLDSKGQEQSEHIMAHSTSFPHPREVLFMDISVQGGIVLQYARRAIFNWIDIAEKTPASNGTASVQ